MYEKREDERDLEAWGENEEEKLIGRKEEVTRADTTEIDGETEEKRLSAGDK